MTFQTRAILGLESSEQAEVDRGELAFGLFTILKATNYLLRKCQNNSNVLKLTEYSHFF